jgi:hypothetical protein
MDRNIITYKVKREIKVTKIYNMIIQLSFKYFIVNYNNKIH